VLWQIELLACLARLGSVWSIFIFSLVGVAASLKTTLLLDPFLDLNILWNRILESLEPVLSNNALIGESVENSTCIL
jgi:hypothetical protein